jgi:hypothetical protein
MSWQQVMEFAPLIGWKPKANLNGYYLTAVEDGVFHVVTDFQGWAGTASIVESDIVVFGDSYAFGYGVDTEAAFFESCRELRLKAIGAPGYNMVQEVLIMDQLSSQLAGKFVVWFVFVGNDLFENLMAHHFHYRMPFVRESKSNQRRGWETVTSHVSPTKWPYTAARYRDFTLWDRVVGDMHSENFLATRAFAACEFLIEKGNDICRRAGAQLLVLTIPDPLTVNHHGLRRIFARGTDPLKFDPDLPDKRIGEICAKFDVAFVAGRNYLDSRHYKARDPHWNEQGHQRMAWLLSSLYYDYMLNDTTNIRNYG